MGKDLVPILLERDQHDVVDSLLGEQIFLVIGQDFKEQPLQALEAGDFERETAQAASSTSDRQRWQIAWTMAIFDGKKR